MNTQSRDEAFGFKRTEGNLCNILDEVGTKMRDDLDEFLNAREQTFTARGCSIPRTCDGRRDGKCFHTCRLQNRTEQSVRKTP